MHQWAYRLGMIVWFASSVTLFSKVVYAESESVCRQYAKVAVATFETSQTMGCHFTNARWQPNYEAHLRWCRTAPALWLKNEQEFRETQLRVCRGDAKAIACNKYAMGAASDQRSNLSGKCGFNGPRWQTSEDEHRRWCLQTSPEAVNNEQAVRFALLGVCAHSANNIRCDQYAKRAVAQGAEGAARQCGFSGPRWTASYEDHLTWCITQPVSNAESEQGKREGPLSQCRTINPLPGGAKPPSQETCTWSVTISNGRCLNADGTASSIQPNSLSAVGCGSNQGAALDNAKRSYNQNFGCSSEGNSPTAGCCVYEKQTANACLCK